MLNNVTLRLPEIVVPGRRLGRHVAHDIRSARFLVAETTTPETVRWDRRIPILDQGDTGSCTGQATVGVLGTEPYYSQLSPVQRAALTEDEALRVYSLATQLDPFDGQWPPTDTGSDGNSAAKAAQSLGFLSGWQHITSLAAAHNAIKTGPFMSGLSWLSGMDTPSSEGIVRATGNVRGGHEFEFSGYNATTGLWECKQSWGDWAKAGTFYLPDEDYNALLQQQGDATVLIPISQPPPTPTPPMPTAVAFTPEQHAALDAFASSPHVWSKATRAAKAWKDATR